MKLRVIATLVAVMAFGAGSASAQSIGVFADLGSASCNITAAPFSSVDFYINVVGTGALPTGGLRGAEFQVVHDFEPGTVLLPTANAAVIVGSPMSGGCNVAFPSCQTGFSVNLYAIQLVFLQEENITANMLVTAHSTPSSPNFACVVVNLCNPPVFTVVCLQGGEAFVNGENSCTVAVDNVTWGEVKSLFN